MSSPFFGLNIGASALRTAQTLVDITNQNIANANTPGYSRQSAVVSASTPEPMPTLSGSGTPGQLGTGVMINTITRARDTFVDGQIRGQLTTQGEVDARGTALTQVEAIVNEPSTTGLSSTLSKYWSAWQEVANTPADSAVRANLVQQGAAVADAFHGQIAQFTQQQHDLDNQVSLAVSNVNTLANQIAAVNTQISQVETSGMHANDLRDQRDVLVDSLSKLVKINVVESGDGQLSINVGNHQLVDKQLVHPMVANAVAGNFTQVQWPDPTAATVSGGSPVLTGAAAGLGGTIVINGVTVTLTPVAATPKLTVAAINTAMGGAVTASLDSAGKLVLTSNVAGSAGSVTVGAITGSIATDLGIVTNILTPGADSVPVNLGGGQLKGLVDSRDVLLKERIDGVNALATRVIESVNGVSASGVGLDGVGGRNFFAGTDATTIGVDPQITAAGGTDKIAAARLYPDPSSATGFSSAAGDSSNALAMAELANQIAARATVPGDLTPGQALAPAPAPVTLVGIDLSGASANTTYKFTVTPPAVLGGMPTVTVANPPSLVPGNPAAITLGTDSAGNKIINVDTGTGRFSVSVPAASFTDVATALAGLNGKSVTTVSGPMTIGDQYAQQISALGVESQTAKSQSTNQSVLVNQLQMQRSSTSGVSLDEETINLITYQKAYQAAAHVITVMDSMLDTLINHTGTGL